MSVSKEKMDSINKDFEKLNADLEGLSEEELKEVAAGANCCDSLIRAIRGGAALSILASPEKGEEKDNSFTM